MNALDYALEKTALGNANAFKTMGIKAKKSLLNKDSFKSGLESLSHVGKGLAGASLGYMAFKQIKDKIQNDTRRKALLEDLCLNDPIISKADKDEVLQYYATIYQIAPKLSLEKSTVRELLQNFIKFGRVDIQTIKTLADTEKSLAQGSGSKTSPMDALKIIS